MRRLRSCHRRRMRQRGFTLIEVVVAFGVLALGLGILLGTLSGAARQVRHADDSGRAALYAQTLLDQVGIGEPLKSGRREGEFEHGRYRWTLEVHPWRDGARPPDPNLVDPSAARLLQVTLIVRWGDRAQQRLHLRTLRLAAGDIGDAGGMP